MNMYCHNSGNIKKFLLHIIFDNTRSCIFNKTLYYETLIISFISSECKAYFCFLISLVLNPKYEANFSNVYLENSNYKLFFINKVL